MKQDFSQRFLRYTLGLLLIASSAAKAESIEDADLVLKGAQAVLNGSTVAAAAAPIGAVDGNLRTKYEPALWELYKAVKGVNFVDGVETPGRTGPQRRLSLRNASLSLRKLTAIQSRHNAAAHTKLEQGMDKVLNVTLVQDNITSARGLVSLAGSYNPLYNFLPTLMNGVDTQKRLEAMRTFLKRLPAEHRRVTYPIFLMKKKPAGADGGGTWKSNELAAFQGAARETTTGIKYAHMDLLLIHDANNLIAEGVIGIPASRVTGTGGVEGIDVWGYTLSHEAGHAVDYGISLQKTLANQPVDSTLAPGVVGKLPGITYAADTFASLNPAPGERVAEAYSRYFMNRSMICEAYPDASYYHTAEETPEQRQAVNEKRTAHRATATYKTCNTKIIEFLRLTKANKPEDTVDEEGNPVPQIFK